MKKSLLPIIFSLVLVLGLTGLASAQYAHLPIRGHAVPSHRLVGSEGGHSADADLTARVYKSLHASPMSVLAGAIPPGTDVLPVETTFPFQSDGRPLHNIQVDPDNPQNIHVVLTSTMDLLDTSSSSSSPNTLLTRRCYYTFSGNGGKTWTTPVLFSDQRTGFPDMQLFKRNGVYVPIIAAHKTVSSGAATIVPGLWIEKGAPGTGNFAECLATNPSFGSGLGWPTMAMSPNADKVYMLASVVPNGSTTENLQFGVFTMDETKMKATFQGWSDAPGNADPNGSGSQALTGAGGETRIRVSPSGKVGLFWANADQGDRSLYFTESTDDGSTWNTSITTQFNQTPSPVATIWMPSSSIFTQNDTFPSLIYGDLDFWYDGESPKFDFTVGATVIGSDGSESYFPSTATIVYYNPNVAAPVNVMTNYFLAGEDTSHFTVYSIPGSRVNVEFPIFAWATIARTTDSNVCTIFYQSVLPADTDIVEQEGVIDTFAYSSIWYQTTTDGGSTWSQHTGALVNSGTGQKFDYREPQTSDWNFASKDGSAYHLLTMVDTKAGLVEQSPTPQAGFDTISFVHSLVVVGNVDGVGGEAPNALGMDVRQNYPNPFNAKTTISFELQKTSDVHLTIEDMLGRTIATVADGRMAAGLHGITFDAGTLPAGVYRYTLRADGASVTKTMSLIK